MGRPRKNIESLKLHGTFRRDRHSGLEPEALGELRKPDGLDHDASELWDQIAPQARRNGAAESDSALVWGCCLWFSTFQRLRREVESGNRTYTALLQASTAWRNFTAAATACGLSPASRAALRVPKTPPAPVARRRSQS
jgi:phage terminase small subunit